jgi:hypothetical protein
VIVHVYNPKTQEAKAGGSQVPAQPRLHHEFQVSLGSIARSCLIESKKQNNFFKIWHLRFQTERPQGAANAGEGFL